MLTKVFSGTDLAAAPADKSLDITPRATDRPPSIIWGFNLSPYVFQIQKEDGMVLTIAQPFCPFKYRLNVKTEKLIIHADSAAMAPAAPLAVADQRFWIGVDEFDQDLFPSPF
jgi:hypothetical protein